MLLNNYSNKHLCVCVCVCERERERERVRDRQTDKQGIMARICSLIPSTCSFLGYFQLHPSTEDF